MLVMSCFLTRPQQAQLHRKYIQYAFKAHPGHNDKDNTSKERSTSLVKNRVEQWEAKAKNKPQQQRRSVSRS